jgi:hypothetical protein
MIQYINIATQNLICVILRENHHNFFKKISLVLPCKALAYKPSIYYGTPFAQNYFVSPEMRGDIRYMNVTKL